MIPQRWLDRFKLIPGFDPVATAGDCWFDAEAADRAVAFFPAMLTHIEGAMAGQPFELGEWQAAVVGCVFGWKRPDGTRRFREVFLYVPRKNGKSTLCGGIVNLLGFCDDEPGAQLYSAAAEREQAALVFRQAKGMIAQNPELSSISKIYNSMKSIEYPGNGVYKALSADADTKHGFNTSGCVVDELHAHRSRDLVDVLATSMGSRRQPLLWSITTADFNRESICNEKYDYACKVRDGIIDDHAFLPVVYEATLEDDWKDPAVWHKANPNLGVSVSEEYLARECKRAQDQPSYENTFKRLHLNIRTQQDKRWMQMDAWDACGGRVDMRSLEGKSCYVGVDLASTRDIAAAVLCFPEEDGFVLVSYFWVPEETVRIRSERTQYDTWASQGHITATPGNVTDYGFIRKTINELSEKYHIEAIGYDPWNARHLMTELGEDDGLPVVEFRQGYATISGPTKDFEALIMSGKVNHGNNPVLRWMASNVAVREDPNGNIKPDKKKSTEKIDGIVAAIMATALAKDAEVNPGKPSCYESRGIVSL